MKKLIFFLLSAWIAAAPAAGAQMKYVAVVETELDEQSGAAADLNKAEVRQMTAELRSVAVKNLPRDKYNIMTSETVMAQGSARLEECAEENCVIALGSMIGADYIVRGIISKFGTGLTISVEMYETENGNLVATSGLVRAENTAELLDKAVLGCTDMYKTFVSSQGPAPKNARNAKSEIKPKSEPKPKLEPKPVAIPPKPDGTDAAAKAPSSNKRYKLVTAVGLDAVGAGVLVYGYTRDRAVNDKIHKANYDPAVENMVKQRNAAYVVGSIILLSGISVHIFF